MGYTYDLTYYLSYFSILIIFLILAIVFAKKAYAWALYSVGVVLTFLSLLGNQKAYSNEGYYVEPIMRPYWCIYFTLSIIAAIIILIRYLSTKDENTPVIEEAKVEETVDEKQGQYLFTCEMCDQGCDKITYAKIKDNMGIRYRNLCDECMKKYNAVPTPKK